MDSLALRLTPSWRRGFDGMITHTAAQATTCVIGISHDELLAVHERNTSFLTHRIARIHCESTRQGCPPEFVGATT